MAEKWAARKGLIFVVAEKWAFAKTGNSQKRLGRKCALGEGLIFRA